MTAERRIWRVTMVDTCWHGSNMYEGAMPWGLECEKAELVSIELCTVSTGLQWFYPNGQYVCMRIRSSVRPSRNVRLCTGNKQLDQDVPIFFPHMHVDSVSPPIDFHPNSRWPWPSFLRSKFESSTWDVQTWLFCKWWHWQPVWTVPSAA